MTRFLLLSAIILLAGCVPKTKVRPYISTAEMPTKTTATLSELTFVSPSENETIMRTYGVFAGTDNDSLQYVLVTYRFPSNNRRRETPFGFFDAQNGAAIRLNDVHELIEVLRLSENEWGAERDVASGTFRHFNHMREYVRESDGVIVTELNFSFTFQINAEGPCAYMWIGEGLATKQIWFSNRDALSGFRANLQKAIDTLESKPVANEGRA